ncbi:MAG TPA: cytochrome P460 family protein [Puia sp.]|nr:cytochrome P460 family protein [Puia sp.]
MKKSKRSKKWSSILVLFFLCVAGAQFIRPRIDNPAVTEDLQAPAGLKQVLKRSCYNCHSNETSLAWFDQLTPANWLVAGHIREGRKVLNFSNWDSLTKDQQKAKLFASLYQAEYDGMPLSQYTMFHPDAKITGQDIAVFKTYLSTLTPGIYSDTAKARAGELQYKKWIQASGGPYAAGPPGAGSPGLTVSGVAILPEFNGIGYIPGFRDWEAISTTERFDNGTLRLILGNDVAVRAIKEQHTNPWPDGAIFAKVAWDQANDSSGMVHAGEFKQVEFMIKDKHKYASSEGWGFGRWVKGLSLVPYGKDANFVTECVNCHRPMKDNDFVFTMPIHPLQAIAPDSLAPNPLAGKVISTIVDKRNKTMSTLYGNEITLKATRTGIPAGYPPGSILSLVTWHQKEDIHYFGANIPGLVASVEQLVFGTDLQKASSPSYAVYEGLPLRKSAEPEAGRVKTRTAWIMDQRASVMP